MARYRWVGAHPYRDHAHGRVIESGESLPDDIAGRVADRHPHDVESITDADEAAPSDSDGAGDGFAPEAWLEVDYRERAERVRSGAVDAHLGAIADAETSQTVAEAVAERRAEMQADADSEEVIV
jgi:hypothetical protein